MRPGYAVLSMPFVAGVLAIVWWAPWSSSPNPVTRAQAAFGDQPVVHVVARPTTLRSDSPLRPLMTLRQTEIWYDRARDRMHVVSQQNGVVGTDRVGRATPGISPLFEFVLHYRSELADGELRSVGRAVIQNRPVIWLRSSTLRVAVDPVSYEPLWVTTPIVTERAAWIQLVFAETKPFDPADFLTAKQKKPRHL